MRLRLLGTGAADGLPNPFCTCARCSAARALGPAGARGHTGVLLDDRLLIELGPDVPRAATAAGIDLAGVSQVLITHGHPDHVHGAALLWRSWSGSARPLQVIGPEQALAQLRPWAGPRDPVRFIPVRAGERLQTSSGHLVAVLAAAHSALVGGPVDDGTAVAYDITTPAGGRLLHSGDTAAVAGVFPPASHEGAPYDAVLLELTFGADGHEHGHLDLDTFPRVLAELASSGATDAATWVAAVHLGHFTPPAAQLGSLLSLWGAHLPHDGQLVELPARASAGSGSGPSADPDAGSGAGADPDAHAAASSGATAGHGPHRTLVLGGARSGKSTHAERLIAALPRVTYVATAGVPVADAPYAEWAARIHTHQGRRPSSWTTVELGERPDELPELVSSAQPGEGLLVDCLTLWLTALLDTHGCWAAPDTSRAVADRATAELVRALSSTAATVVLISNEVGSGIVPEHSSGRLFRDLLGRMNAHAAQACDQVTLVVAGMALDLTQPRRGDASVTSTNTWKDQPS